MTRTFDENSSRRIARSVIWTERQEKFVKEQPPEAKPLPPTIPLVGLADGNIASGAFGTVDVATGNDFDSSIVAHSTRQYTNVYNPGPDVSSGDRVLIQPCRLSGSSRTRWNIIQSAAASSFTLENVVFQHNGGTHSISSTTWTPIQWIGVDHNTISGATYNGSPDYEIDLPDNTTFLHRFGCTVDGVGSGSTHTQMALQVNDGGWSTISHSRLFIPTMTGTGLRITQSTSHEETTGTSTPYRLVTSKLASDPNVTIRHFWWTILKI